jgi:ABC-type transporter Mla subunit MlaD
VTSSLGDIRAALAEVGGLTADARRHADLAAACLDEAVSTLAELVEQTHEDLPVDALTRARDDVAEVSRSVSAAADAIADLDARI